MPESSDSSDHLSSFSDSERFDKLMSLLADNRLRWRQQHAVFQTISTTVVLALLKFHQQIVQLLSESTFSQLIAVSILFMNLGLYCNSASEYCRVNRDYSKAIDEVLSRFENQSEEKRRETQLIADYWKIKESYIWSGVFPVVLCLSSLMIYVLFAPAFN